MLHLSWVSSPGVSHVTRTDRGLLASTRAEYSLLDDAGRAKWCTTLPFGALSTWNDGLVWFGEVSGAFYVAELDWKTGKEVRRQALSSVPMVELPTGEMVGYERDSSLRTLVRRPLWGNEGPRWSRSSSAKAEEWDSSAAVLEDRVFVGVGQHLACLALDTGEDIWRSSMVPVEVDLTPGKMWPVVHGDRVVSNGAWGIIAFDTKSGEKAWHHMHPSWKTVVDGKVYCLSRDYTVLDVRTGQILVFASLADRIQEKFGAKGAAQWRGGLNFARPVVWGDRVLFGDDRGRLWAIEKDTGEPVWFHKPKGGAGYLNAEPVIDGNRLFITSFSMDPKLPSALYCYERRQHANH